MPRSVQRRQPALGMSGRDDSRIADHQHPPGSQLARQFAERFDLVGPEDNPRARLKVEGNHGGFGFSS